VDVAVTAAVEEAAPPALLTAQSAALADPNTVKITYTTVREVTSGVAR